MLERVRTHFQQNVIGYLALFVALGGTSAYAANTVFSTDIVDGEVKTPDLATDAVTQPKLRDAAVGRPELANGVVSREKLNNGAVDGSKVFDDSLTGADVTSLTGADVTDNTLTGADISDNSTLGNLEINEDSLNVVQPEQLLSGSALYANTNQALLLQSPDAGIRILDDGDTVADVSVMVENTDTTAGAPAVTTVDPGASVEISVAGTNTLEFFVKRSNTPQLGLAVRCGFDPNHVIASSTFPLVSCFGHRFG
jgi:hypothetical protein